jgi:cytochrome c oxidase assembly factor CtaG
MTQHILLADVAGPLLLIGLRTPVLVFFWPKPMLVVAAHSRVIRGIWHIVTKPAVALTIWALTLYVWHVPSLYESALQSDVAHSLEHASFVLTGALVWWPLIDPAGTGNRSGVWKAGYLFVARTLSGALGVAMIVSSPWYESYIRTAPLYGLTPATDQQIAGVIMMSVDFLIVTVIGMAFIISSFPSDDAGRRAQLQNDHEPTV